MVFEYFNMRTGVRYFSENLQYLFAGSSFGSLTAIFGTLCPAGAIGTDQSSPQFDCNENC
jgi:hypothetical protein